MLWIFFLNFWNISDMNSKQNLKLWLLFMPGCGFQGCVSLEGCSAQLAGTQCWCRQGHRLWTWVRRLNTGHSMPQITPLIIPAMRQMTAFAQSGDLGELSTTHHHSWKPQRSACPTESGSLQYKKGGVTLFIQNQAGIISGEKLHFCCWFIQKCR